MSLSFSVDRVGQYRVKRTNLSCAILKHGPRVSPLIRIVVLKSTLEWLRKTRGRSKKGSHERSKHNFPTGGKSFASRVPVSFAAQKVRYFCCRRVRADGGSHPPNFRISL